MVTAVDDDALLERCARGDERALGELFDTYGRSAYALARRITRDDGLAEDVVQEAFLDAWRRAARFDATLGKASTWILTLVHRRAVDAVRRASVRPRPLAADVGDLPEPVAPDDVARDVALRDEAAGVRAALATLPPQQRRVIELAYLDGYSQSEIAALLSEPLGTVKSRTHTALTTLRTVLEGRAV
jgi:RNA polymerase sigma-70 factor (ECF subfamily)